MGGTWTSLRSASEADRWINIGTAFRKQEYAKAGQKLKTLKFVWAN